MDKTTKLNSQLLLPIEKRPNRGLMRTIEAALREYGDFKGADKIRKEREVYDALHQSESELADLWTGFGEAVIELKRCYDDFPSSIPNLDLIENLADKLKMTWHDTPSI